ncbi:YkgJ family cysteine cluster protein [Paraburkholderia kururiensis]|uniref:YkgJ family cysteine cluster protein n=2 Tax=Paraburkholderia TaxID=1822464 RepID=UPI003B9EC1C2
MGEAKQRGSKEQRIAEARLRDAHKPSMPLACASADSHELLQRMIPIYREMDAHLNESPAHIDCAPGCSFCCYYHVLVTPAEAFALAEFIENSEVATRDAIKTRVIATAERVAPLSQSEYMQTNIPCAFLENGRCAVYPLRPAACRGFHSRDVGVCKRAFENPRSAEPQAVDSHRQRVLVRHTGAFFKANSHAGCEVAAYEMHGAVASALVDPEAFSRWRRGATTFPSVRDRTPIVQR